MALCRGRDPDENSEIHDELRHLRREGAAKQQRIQERTDELVRVVGRRDEEARERGLVVQELQAAYVEHRQQLADQLEELKEEHQETMQRQRESAEERRSELLEEMQARPLSDFSESGAQSSTTPMERVKEEEASNQLRVDRAREELEAVTAEVRHLVEERRSEAEAAVVRQQACAAQQRVAEWRAELLQAEMRTRNSEKDALQDTQRGLEGKIRSLQSDLTKLSYSVGLKDHELKVKDMELQEVRQSLGDIQDDMDDVNLKLKEQCGRVQRVETSLRISRDLGERVRLMRTMLTESHGALSQLCDVLEQERARRDQCEKGLKQQRVRTELLLQLLHHFKSRTQDLAPNMLPEALLLADPLTQEAGLGSTGMTYGSSGSRS